MTHGSKIWLATNAASGSNDEALVARIRELLEAGGAQIVRATDCRDDDLPDRRSVEKVGATHLLVLGGDGTLNSVLSRMEGWTGHVLPLPGGTANLLCRGLHGDSDPEAIVARFLAGELVTRRVPCVRGAGTIALAELLAGPGAKWADVREEMREGDVARIVESASEAAGESVSGAAVRIAEPAMGRDQGYPGVRLSPWPGGIHVQGYGGEGLVDLLKQGLAILGRDFRDGPHDDLGEHPGVTLESLDGTPIELMADGERLTGSAREAFSLAELEVDLLGPPA